ncbi:hypothetical protein [Gordonia alkaliphila]|uniref:Uncharacterized protein n=1 Tax=Gordonia alkaliphila TaxID=1053547 RepID=A0ABP8Z525_9ACTN
MKKIGKWLTWSGLAIAVVSVIVGIVLAVIGLGKVADTVNESFRVNGPTTHVAEANSSLWLYSASTGIAVPSCTAAGPATVQQSTMPSDASFDFNTDTVTMFGKLHFPEAGTYTIDCDSVGVVAGPEISTSSIVTGAGGVLLAVFGGGLGGLLLVIGVILWAVGASRAKNAPPIAWQPDAQQYPMSGYPGQPGQQYPSQQYPNQQYPNQPGYQPGAPDPYRPQTPDEQPPTNP